MVAVIVLYLGMFLGFVLATVIAIAIAAILPVPLWAKIILGLLIWALSYFVIGGFFCIISMIISKIQDAITLNKAHMSSYPCQDELDE